MNKYLFFCLFICVVPSCVAAESDTDESSARRSAMAKRIERLAEMLKICSDDKTRFNSIMNDLNTLTKTLSKRYGKTSAHKVITTVLRILLHMCEQQCIQQAETLIELVEVLSRKDLPTLNKFLDDLLQVFKGCSFTGCYLLAKIEQLLMCKGKKPKTLIEFLHNITIFCKLMLEKDFDFEDIVDSLDRLLQVYYYCFVYADIIVKVQIIVLKNYGTSKARRIPSFFIGFLDVAIIMIETGYDDILAEILDLILRSSRKFDLCRKSFFEILEDIIGELLLLMQNPCEKDILIIVGEIEKVLCNCSREKHPRDSDEDDMYASGIEDTEDEDEDEDYDDDFEDDDEYDYFHGVFDSHE